MPRQARFTAPSAALLLLLLNFAAPMATAMRAVVPEDGKCVVQEMEVPQPGGDELLVRVHGTAVNRADTLQRRGKTGPPPGASPVLGLEMAGVVERAGPNCSLGFEPGDRIMGLLVAGGYADYVTISERLAMRVPDSSDLTTAGGLPETWLTAYQLLHFVGGVRAGDVVLIHAAGSGVGTAATQLAVAAGATVIATAGRADKLEMAKSLGASLAVNYKTEDWAEAVLAHTGGRGADLALDCVGGQYWEKHVAALAPDSRWVLYGLMGGPTVEGPLLAHLLKKRIRLEATTLRARPLEYKAALTEAMWAHAGPKFGEGAYRVIVDRAFPLEDAQAAHEYVEGNQSMGKVLIRVGEAAGKDEL